MIRLERHVLYKLRLEKATIELSFFSSLLEHIFTDIQVKRTILMMYKLMFTQLRNSDSSVH